MRYTELVNKCVDIAKNYNTLYVMGCFGAPLTEANKKRYTVNHSYNKQAERTKKINAQNENVFGFDCICLIKGILWGWNGDKSNVYGGASYASNGVQDVGADAVMHLCTDVSTDFTNIQPGEIVHMPGHVGIYIGDGKAVECTPIWYDGVQITAVGNIGTITGYNTRTWVNHGKLPWVDYTIEKTSNTKTVEEIAKEVIANKWGVGAARKEALTKAGYNYDEVQAKVNELLKTTTTKTITVGSKVKIKSGAVYGGLSSARGKSVPSSVINKTLTVSKIQENKGVKEALLKEITSWVAVSSLTGVD